jgi:hypothetical protein
VLRQVREYCRTRGLRAPSRGTIYNAFARASVPSFSREDLPESVLRTLHNIGGREIPGHQIVFAAFNYGDTRAISYASALPWSCLQAAARLRGWRPKSAALLAAVMRYRKS